MSESALEAAFLHWWGLLAPPGTPQPEREVKLIPGRRSRCDFVWRRERLVVEIDGGQWKAGGGRHNTDEDRDKMNTLQALGWRVLHYSGTMLKADPQAIIDQVVTVLNAWY